MECETWLLPLTLAINAHALQQATLVDDIMWYWQTFTIKYRSVWCKPNHNNVHVT